jgi:hypothetical protein
MKRVLRLSVIFLAGCAPGTFDGGPDGGSPPAPDLAGQVDWCKTNDCSNVVDAVLVPMLGENGLLPALREDDGVLCRRMAVDLTGLVPTQQEIDDHCTGKTPGQMADYFMTKPTGANAPDGSPPYVFVNRRWWADSFQYQFGTSTTNTFYHYLLDLDQLVGQLYAGKIRYDQFVERALASPAFARRFGIFEANHDLVQIASQAFRVFLGREALPSEAEDFGNLWRGWSSKYMASSLTVQLYPDLPACPDPVNGCYYAHYELGLDGTQCAGAKLASCQSQVLGAGAMVPQAAGFVRWADLTPADRYALEEPGRLIVAQPEFAEAAVDRALAKYLGWWKAGFYRPDYDLPAVRDALVRKFVADAYDLRKLEREIVTSLLYAQAAHLRAGAQQTDPWPIWGFGPTKMMYAEAWLDSLGQATGRQLAGCDWRYGPNTYYRGGYPGIFQFPYSAGQSEASYTVAASDLGGCPVASTHGSASGLVPSIRRRAELASLCVKAFAPPSPMSNDALVQKEFAALGRDPSPAEVKVWSDHMAACDPSVDACDPQSLADKLCTSLYATALSTYY